MSNGFIAYTGPSMIDGKPVKVITTGTTRASVNIKTADMLQVWILPASCKPSDAVQNGADSSVCGTCPHRPLVAKSLGKAPCYVNTGQAPNRIYGTAYGDQPSNPRNAPIRLGAWGEPTAAPYEVMESLVDLAPHHTGYTHRWQSCDPRFKQLLMASVDSEFEAVEAKTEGWRYFRVMGKAGGLLPGEILCPASKEAGNKTTCDKCGLCAGLTRKAKNIAIYEH